MPDASKPIQGNRMFVRGNPDTNPLNPQRVAERAAQIAREHGRDASQVTDDDQRIAWRQLREQEGAGPVDYEAIERRAEELAVINGREAANVTEEDRYRAWCELRDIDVLELEKDKRARSRQPRDPAEPAVVTKHVEDPAEPLDEARFEERTAEEGVQEADHEKLYEARRGPPPEE